MICISPPLTWFSRLLTFIIAESFAITVLLIFAYLVTLRNAIFPTVHWDLVVTFLFSSFIRVLIWKCSFLKQEMIYTSMTAIGYFIFSIIHLSLTNRDDYEISITYYGFYNGYIAAGVSWSILFHLCIHNSWYQNHNKATPGGKVKAVPLSPTLSSFRSPVAGIVLRSLFRFYLFLCMIPFSSPLCLSLFLSTNRSSRHPVTITADSLSFNRIHDFGHAFRSLVYLIPCCMERGHTFSRWSGRRCVRVPSLRQITGEAADWHQKVHR